MKKLLYISVLFIIFISACSTKKNTVITRAYHNLTSHYNIFFNGRESYKAALLQLKTQHKDDYAEVLPIFLYKNKKEIQGLGPQMDKAIKKSSKAIKMHSLKAKPKRPKNREMTKKERAFYAKKEFCKWIDDSYLLIGKANFYKEDYAKAINSFNQILNQYSKENTFYPARLWLLKTYIESNRFSDAKEQIEIIKNNRKFPENLKTNFILTQADYFLAQNKPDKAIPLIEKATQMVKKKQRARLYFILAQLNTLQKRRSAASNDYAKVIKLKPEYEMLFNAQINRAVLLDADQNSEQLEKNLLKLLNDVKNKDYNAQIYFALAKIAQTKKDKPAAIKYFRACTQSPDAKGTQKALAFLALGDMYFADANYLLAGAYYDSTMNFLNEKYSRYDELSEQTRNLKALIGNLNIIQREDSLQYVAAMPEKERMNLIDNLIRRVKQKEAEEKRTMQGTANNLDNAPMNTSRPGQGGKWYFYNQASIGYGSQEFKKKWGNRKLEDNWRRSNKKSVAATVWDSQDDKNESEADKALDNKKPEYYLRNLPLNDSLKAISNEKIAKALFKVGSIYDEKLNEPKLSAENYTKLVKRFPNSDLSIQAAYKLYLLAQKNHNSGKMVYWKNYLNSKYPKSNYAKILNDPDYLKLLKTQQKQAEILYESAYNDYKAKKLSNVIDKAHQAERNFPTHKLIPKFKLLAAFATAEQGDAKGYLTQLDNISKKYQGTVEKQRADEILNTLLNSSNQDENSAINEAQINKAQKLYSYNPKAKNFVVFYFLKPNKDLNRLRFDVFNVAVDKYTDKNLEVKISPITEKLKVVVVQSFTAINQAKQFASVVGSELAKKQKQGVDYDYFLISVKNFSVLKQNKDMQLYLKFYKKFY